jgi:hypothetical protein
LANYKKLLLFHMDDDKAALIKSVCGGLGIRVVKIYRHQYGETIGALAGIPLYAMTNQPYRGEGFDREMMVMCGLPSDELDAFLAACRDAKIEPVRLKAILTPHNMAWPAARLYEELCREDRQMHHENQ